MSEQTMRTCVHNCGRRWWGSSKPPPFCFDCGKNSPESTWQITPVPTIQVEREKRERELQDHAEYLTVRVKRLQEEAGLLEREKRKLAELVSRFCVVIGEPIPEDALKRYENWRDVLSQIETDARAALFKEDA